MSGKRLVMSKFGNKLIKNILQINSNEFTTSYRGFNLLKLKNFHLNQVNNKGYSFFMGTLFEIDKLGYKIREIPIIGFIFFIVLTYLLRKKFYKN